MEQQRPDMVTALADQIDRRSAVGDRVLVITRARWGLAKNLAARGFDTGGPNERGVELAPALPAERRAELHPRLVPGPFHGVLWTGRADALEPEALADAVAEGGWAHLRVEALLATSPSALLRELSVHFALSEIEWRDSGVHLDLLRRDGATDTWSELLSPAHLLEHIEALARTLEASTLETLRGRTHARASAARSVVSATGRQRTETARLRERVIRLEAELASIRRSTRYRLADALTRAARPSKDTLRLPRRVVNLYRDRKRPVEERVERTSLDRHRVQRLKADVEAFAAHVRQTRPEWAVFMLSGTTFVNPVRANRPIRLTRVLRGRNIPVLFGYHGRIDAPDLPDNPDPGLTQIPIELTEQIIHELHDLDLGSTKKLFIVSYPHPCVVKAIGRFASRGWLTFYDCRDDWEAFAEVGAARWYDPAIERFVVAQCERSFAVSWPLRDKIRAFAPQRRIETSPNAYDPGFLSPGYVHAPDDKPVIGYFGHLTAKWFDWPSLFWMAEQRPHYTFEIIGHQAPDGLRPPPNVQLLGPKTHPEICEIASRWRVGIIPFRPSLLADAVDPIKIYEYFGLGLPVVSFRMPQIDDYPHTRTVDTPAGFVAALDAAIEEGADPAVLAHFLETNTWEHRVDQFLDAAREEAEAPRFEKLLGGAS